MTRPFHYGDYVSAKTALLDALQGPCFYALVVGAPGTGKTSLLREIAAQCDSRRHHIAYLSSARASLTGIVHLLARRLHLRPRRSHLECVEALTQVMAAQTARVLLWLDEAEQIDVATLEQLRTLVEATPTGRSFSVVLAGQPALESRLDTPRLAPLAHRLDLRLSLTGLRRDELDAFLAHRFGTEAAARLSPSALDELFERCAAVPALLDRIVRRLLALSLYPHPGVIDVDQVRAVLDRASL